MGSRHLVVPRFHNWPDYNILDKLQMLNLRCRAPAGQFTITVDPKCSVDEFCALLSEKSGLIMSKIEVLTGFPPRPLQLVLGEDLSTLPIANGEMLTIRELSGPEKATPPAVSDTSKDAELARALAASLAAATPAPAPPPPVPQPRQHVAPPSAAAAGTGHGTGPGPSPGPARTSVPLPDGTLVTRRIIDSDNSCLFNAVGYVMEHSRQKAPELRQVIAGVVASDPDTYSEAFLGKSNAEYCEWIQSSDKWGGAIELSILCNYYGREIAAYDIQTKRCDIYGQDAGYAERAMLIYDGLHYDALAVSMFEGAPEDLDITIFRQGSEEGRMIDAGAQKLVAEAHVARQFTDTANFTLRCGVCQIGLKGEKEAMEHAKSTGHSNFAEY